MKTSIPWVWALCGVCAAGAVGGSAWLMRHKAAAKPLGPKLVYTSQGFGGYVTAPTGKPEMPPKKDQDPVLPALHAYDLGHYKEATSLAEPIARQYQLAPDPKERRYGVEAIWVEAYSAARQKDFYTARERFGYMRDRASELPDKGAQKGEPGEILPTLEEEGSFQHAVCTSALGEKPAAAAEYLHFMKQYPLSVLIHGSVKRIARMHNGDTPQEAEKVWKQALQLQKKDSLSKERAASVCGPACLSELLRRRGVSVSVDALAKEMKTSAEGTSMQAMMDAGARHNLPLQGLALTAEGLKQQKLPAVALIQPNHFVLIEEIRPNGVQVWDPNGKGLGQAESKLYPATAWNMLWSGSALVSQ